MKIKTHTFKWAVALCAVAVFSFTAAVDAQARILPGSDPGPVTAPPPAPSYETDVTPTTSLDGKPTEPLPPAVLPVGTYNGTVTD
jgi:hypothetical protein